MRPRPPSPPRVGLTKGRISQLVAEGLPVRADGRIDVAVGLAWIENNLDPARRNRGGAAVPTRAATTLAEAKRLHEIVKGPARQAGVRARAGPAGRDRRPPPGPCSRVPVPNATRTWLGSSAPHPCWPPRSAPIPAPLFAALDRMMREHLGTPGRPAAGELWRWCLTSTSPGGERGIRPEPADPGLGLGQTGTASCRRRRRAGPLAHPTARPTLRTVMDALSTASPWERVTC